MSRTETVKGVIKTFVWLTKAELDSMDHKLFRLGLGAVSFLAAGLFWYYVFNGGA